MKDVKRDCAIHITVESSGLSVCENTILDNCITDALILFRNVTGLNVVSVNVEEDN